MDDIPIFYTLEKATDLTDYLTDVHNCRVHYNQIFDVESGYYQI